MGSLCAKHGVVPAHGFSLAAFAKLLGEWPGGVDSSRSCRSRPRRPSSSSEAAPEIFAWPAAGGDFVDRGGLNRLKQAVPRDLVRDPVVKEARWRPREGRRCGRPDNNEIRSDGRTTARSLDQGGGLGAPELVDEVAEEAWAALCGKHGARSAGAGPGRLHQSAARLDGRRGDHREAARAGQGAGQGTRSSSLRQRPRFRLRAVATLSIAAASTASSKRCRETCAGPVGREARWRSGRAGVVTDGPDSDKEIKVRWDDGTQSGWIKVAALARPNSLTRLRRRPAALCGKHGADAAQGLDLAAFTNVLRGRRGDPREAARESKSG